MQGQIGLQSSVHHSSLAYDAFAAGMSFTAHLSIKGRIHSFADVWSFGVALYVGATGRWPFGTADEEVDRAFGAFLKVTGQAQTGDGPIAASPPTVETATQLSSGQWRWPRLMGEQLKEVIALCLQVRADRRPTAAQLQELPWFKA
jgi:serine/threonine protein kinase